MHHLLKNIKDESKSYIISIDAQTLYFSDEFMHTIELKSKDLNRSHIIISINLQNVTAKHFPQIIESIQILKKLGFKVCLDCYNETIGSKIWEETDIDYIVFDPNYWHHAKDNNKKEYILKKKLAVMHFGNTIPIFTNIDDEEDFHYLKKLVNKDTLLCGDYFEESKKLNIEG